MRTCACVSIWGNFSAMTPRFQVSRAAIELAKTFEGYRRSSARLADGGWTVGYGHTLTAREGVDINEADAEALLIYDLMQAANLVTDTVYTPLNQNQFDALACFAFAIGGEKFRGSNVLKLINEGAMTKAALAIEAWRTADFEGDRLVVDALIRRRSAEKALFLTPPGGFVPAPAAVLKAELDPEAAFADVINLAVVVDGDDAVLTPVEAAPGADSLEQEYLPMDYPPADISSLKAEDEDRRESVEEAAAVDVAGETPLYDIPGYSSQEGFHPGRPKRLSMLQLIGLGAIGLVFLGVAFAAVMRAASSEGGPGMYLLAGLAAVFGAAGLFSSLYLILNRIEGDE